MLMDWNRYGELVDEKVKDAWHNWEQAETKARQAKAAYNSAMFEKKAFEKHVNELVDKLDEK